MDEGPVGALRAAAASKEVSAAAAATAAAPGGTVALAIADAGITFAAPPQPSFRIA